MKITSSLTLTSESLTSLMYVRSCWRSTITVALYYIVSNILDAKSNLDSVRCREIWARGHSRPLKMTPFDRSCMTSYQSGIVSIVLSCGIFEIFDFEEYWNVRYGSLSLQIYAWTVHRWNLDTWGYLFAATVWVYFYSVLYSELWAEFTYLINRRVTVTQGHWNQYWSKAPAILW